MAQDQTITIYHSPDADDAFMFYGLTHGDISYPGYQFTHELCDIESLNKRAIKGEIDCTAVSVHAFAYLKNQYVILTCGASMGGKDYGPRLVASKSFDLLDGKSRKIAMPGENTSAALAFQIYMKEKGVEAELINLDFDAIQDAVKNGEVDAGVIIHEGQITHEREGLTTLLDLGAWWWEETGKPLPLGVNVVRKSLGPDAVKGVAKVLKESITYSLEHRKEALEYALQYGRGISYDEADTFVAMYVNDKTLDIGTDGVESIREFLGKGVQYGIIPEGVEIEFA